jgi:hypothetical protein
MAAFQLYLQLGKQKSRARAIFVWSKIAW